MTVTLDTSFNTNFTYTNGNLTYQTTYNYNLGHVRATEGKSSGKWYFELKLDYCFSPWNDAWGINVSTRPSTGGVREVTLGANEYCNEVSSMCSPALGAGSTDDIIHVAMDLDTGKCWIGLNGVWCNGGDPGAGTGECCTVAVGGGEIYYAAGTGGYASTIVTANFGGSAFAYTKPSGFLNYDNSTNPVGWDSDSAVCTDAVSCTYGAPYTDANAVKCDFECCWEWDVVHVGDQHCGTIEATDNLTPTTGKWYFELFAYSNVAGYPACHKTIGGFSGCTADFDSTPTSNMIVGIAFDADAGKVWFRYNGTAWDDGDPVAGTGGTSFAGPYKPYVNFSSWSCSTYPIWPVSLTCNQLGNQKRTVEAYWGDTAFFYEAPTGFSALYDHADPPISYGTIAEGLGFSDAVVSNETYEGILSEDLAFGDAAAAPYPADLDTSEGIKFGELIEADLPFDMSISEGLGFSEEIETDPYVVIEEGIGFADSVVEMESAITEPFGLGDAVEVTSVQGITCQDVTCEVEVDSPEVSSTYEPPIGDGVVTLPSLSVVGYTGAAGSVELPSFTADATIVRGVSADGSVELPALAAVGYTGWQHSASLPGFTAAATGTVSLPATASITIPPITCIGRAVVSKSIDLPAFEVAATATVGMLYEGTVVLPSLEVSATAIHGITASAAVTLPELILHATANRGSQGSASLILPLMIVEATGEFGINADGSMSIPALTILGSFYTSVSADGTVTLPALELLGKIGNPGQYDAYILEHDRSRGKCA